MYVHGDNLQQKERHSTKYDDSTARKFLSEIRPLYD